MVVEYIPINKDIIPYQMEIVLNNTTYQFEFYYNTYSDYFTVNLYKNNEIIIYGEKLVYNSRLFGGYDYLDIPTVLLYPIDPTKKSERVTYENLGEDVFLFIVGDENVD